jgi:hypothetical protein
MSNCCADADTDLVKRRIALLLWGVPAVLMVIGAFMEPTIRTMIWAPALAVAGGACVRNAGLCGRRHCYLTGPLYLAAALVTVLCGMEMIEIPWGWIGWGVIGGTALAYVPEWLSGRYVRVR